METLYHVTFTKNVRRILKSGLMTFRPTIWVRAGDKKRHGDGSVYAFEDHRDALRWAGRMDWAFHMKTGSGKISIVSLAETFGWEADLADPLSQAGHRGQWLKRREPVPPEDILGSEVVTTEMLRTLISQREKETEAEIESSGF